MSTHTTQLKITLPVTLQKHLRSRADRFGLTMSAYVKHLIIDDVKELDIPVFPMSEEQEEKGLKAMAEHEAGKTLEINSIDDFMNAL